MNTPIRYPWGDFPPVVSHSRASYIRNDKAFDRASSGDLDSARQLVSRHFSSGTFRPPAKVDFVAAPIRISPDGNRDMLPLALALAVAKDLGAKVAPCIVQTHTFVPQPKTSTGLLAQQPAFDGHVPQGNFVIAVNHLDLGSTTANLRGYLMSQGANVISATALSCEIFSENLTPDKSLLQSLHRRFNDELETLPQIIGHTASTLTNREAYFLNGLRSLAQIRDLQTSQRHGIRP